MKLNAIEDIVMKQSELIEKQNEKIIEEVEMINKLNREIETMSHDIISLEMWKKVSLVFNQGHFNSIFMSIISVKYLFKYFQERSLHVTGLVLLSIAIYVYIPWPGDLPSIKPGVLAFNGSMIANTSHVSGCDDQKQVWSLYVPKLREFKFC